MEISIQPYLYMSSKAATGQEDLTLIQKMGLGILEQGRYSTDLEIQLLTLFGAGISGNDDAIPILEMGVLSNQPLFQNVAINFLAQLQNDRATEMINYAMSSNSLLIRLEAAFNLAKNKSPKAPGQIESLMQKSPPEALPIFPQLLATCGDKNSIRMLQKLLVNSDESTRVQAVLAIAKSGRDDLLPEIRRLSTHLNVAQQEACAFTLGVFKDESSASKLLTLSKSSVSSVKLAALQALYRLGREEKREEVEELARKEDLFAIYMLGSMPQSEPTLLKLIQSPNINVRINAGLALLKLHHRECLNVLPEIFIKDKRDLAFVKHFSHGHSLVAWRVVPSAKQNYSDNPVGLELSLNMREEALVESLELSELDFLALANLIFTAQQYDLVPTLTQLLSNLHTTNAIKLLKIYREKVGAPIIRNYCNLALYRAKEEGPYASDLREWITSHHNHELIQFRQMVPWEQRSDANSNYSITPEDATRLLVESLESMIQANDENAIDTLLKAIRYGNNKNRYALAGLLMRTAH